MTPPQPPTAIIGLGLIGGSLARDLAAAGRRILAFDSHPDTLAAACEAGVVHQVLDAAFTGIGEAKCVVVATPVDVALAALERLAPAVAADAVVTDVGSVKRTIGDLAVQLGLGPRFAGSHPIAGDHRSGWSASRLGLFAGATVYVCPTEPTSGSTIEIIRQLWASVGGVPEISRPDEHDRRMAWVSHLPQIVSSALAAALARSGEDPDRLGPGGRDMTRLAGSAPELWSAICAANADHIGPALEQLLLQLQSFSSALEERDRSALQSFFTSGRSWVS